MRKTALFLLLGLVYAYAVISLGHASAVYYDARQYFDYAKNLLETGTYGLVPGQPDIHREPGYGVYLAALLAAVKGAGFAPSLEAISSPEKIFWVKLLQAYVLFLSAALCAFHGALPERVRRPFFFLVVLSPTFVGAMREIYSEALAIPLSLLFLFFFSRAIALPGWGNRFGTALAWAAQVLAKSVLYYSCYAFLLLAAALAFRRRTLPLLLAFVFAATGGLAAQRAWKLRTASLGANADEARLSIALAGKIARLDEVSWEGNVIPALAASLGTNFCDRHFGADRCAHFDYRACDEVGPRYLREYTRRLGSAHLADEAIKHDMFTLWFHRPLTQLAGSGLELLRMTFFESVIDAGSLPGFLQAPARAWHIVGSLALWALILLSWVRLARTGIRLDTPEGGIVLVCGAILFYHAVSMAQITNVARYVFAVLPFAYYFAADGAALAWEKLRTWKK
jgi:hypothetical protein